MTDAKIKEQERQSARIMSWAAAGVNLALLALEMMQLGHVAGMRLGIGANILLTVVITLNLVVTLYATKRYAAIRGKTDAQRQHHALGWIAGGLLAAGVLALALTGWSWWLVGGVCGGVVGFLIVWLVWIR